MTLSMSDLIRRQLLTDAFGPASGRRRPLACSRSTPAAEPHPRPQTVAADSAAVRRAESARRGAAQRTVIALRNDMEGVPGITQKPIAPERRFTDAGYGQRLIDARHGRLANAGDGDG